MTTASAEAYSAIVDKLPAKRAAVFHHFRAYVGGLTIRETCDVTGWGYNTVSARIHELAERGLIEDSSNTRGRQTVWIMTPADKVEEVREARRKEREKRKSPDMRRLERDLQQVRVVAANLAGYAASVNQDGRPNQPEWVAGLIEHVEAAQKVLGIA